MQQQAVQYTDYRTEMLPAFEAVAAHDHLTSMAMVLAGGRGERLYPLTGHRAKPAVPFGGSWRLIDFVLSNLFNSEIPEIHILTQYNDQSLLRHLQEGWIRAYFADGPLIVPTPAHNGTSYLGTADAVYKNRVLINCAKPDLVLIFGSDHVYRMDVNQMIKYHLEQGAEVTVSAIPVPIDHCAQFGTVVVDDEWRIRKFEEKVPMPTSIPGRPDQALASMGNYIFDAEVLLEELEQDALNSESSHDFGRDILPRICARRRMYAYDFRSNRISDTEGPNDYWRDVGTIESYYQAHMDLNSPQSRFNLEDPTWPLRSIDQRGWPARMARDLSGKIGCVENSIVGNSSVVKGGYVRDSVIGQNVYIASGAVVEESVIMGNCLVEKRARIRGAVIDHGNVIGEGERIGYDLDSDSARYYVDRSGVVVVPHNGYKAPLLKVAYDYRLVGERSACLKNTERRMTS
jgi:glucose-1-phosphate adenylyltransferase